MAGKIYCGDNLEVLSSPEFFGAEMVDLVYADPPFNSQRTYNIVYKDSNAQAEAFKDYWTWTEAAPMYARLIGDPHLPRSLRPLLESLHERLIDDDSDLLAYLTMMTPRLVAMHRVLKRTGSLYLHCDPTASHYLKIVLDAIFRPHGGKFLNEIIWKRTGAHNGALKFGPVHDVILLYTKTDEYTWNTIFQKLPQETADEWFNNIEEGTLRRFNRNTLTAPGIRKGSSGLPWRGIDPTVKGRHWSVPGFARKVIGDLDTLEALEALDRMGRVFWPQKVGGTPMLKMYLDESEGVPAQDVWTDIKLPTSSGERIGYPTQKPLNLLKRIITASSNHGDIVLDPFCGCGTTVEASEALGRRWFGVDIATKAVDVIKDRFKRVGLDEPEIDWHPADKDAAYALAAADKHGFEKWALRKIRAARVRAKDRGIDGEALFKDGDSTSHVIVSVKAGGVKPADVRDLRGTLDREHAPIGIFVTAKEPSDEMKLEAVRLGFLPVSDAEGPIPRLQFVNIERMFGPLPAIRAPGRNVTEMPKPTIPPPPAIGEQLGLAIDQKVRDAKPSKPTLRSVPKAKPAKKQPVKTYLKAPEQEMRSVAESNRPPKK